MNAQTNAKKIVHDEMNFWIGNWDLYWYEKDSLKATGENIISKFYNDNVIREQFKVLTGSQMGYEGSSWSMFDAPSGIWKQTWVDNQGSYLDFVGGEEKGNRTFSKTNTKKDGTETTSRMVFKNVKKDSFVWDWETTNDGGKTWVNNWQIFYTRRK